MFEGLDANQKALLYRALSTELNAIDKLTQQACAMSDSPDSAMSKTYRGQYDIVYNMVLAIYGEDAGDYPKHESQILPQTP